MGPIDQRNFHLSRGFGTQRTRGKRHETAPKCQTNCVKMPRKLPLIMVTKFAAHQHYPQHQQQQKIPTHAPHARTLTEQRSSKDTNGARVCSLCCTFARSTSFPQLSTVCTGLGFPLRLLRRRGRVCVCVCVFGERACIFSLLRVACVYADCVECWRSSSHTRGECDVFKVACAQRNSSAAAVMCARVCVFA